VTEIQAETMKITCIDAPANAHELTIAGLKSAPSVKMRPPRIADSPVSLECRLHATAPLGLNQVILIGRSVHAHVADHFVIDPDEPEFNTPTPRPIGGMHEAKWYTRTGDLFDMERPTWAEWQRRRKVK